MYIKRLIVKNYRSIKFIDITFSSGKNVIVGRNNAGKSNIVKALDIVLGEKSPTYRSENITETDFFSYKTTDSNGVKQEHRSNNMSIYCELEMLAGEVLEFEEINKCRGYYKLVSNKGSRGNPDVEERFDPIEPLDGGYDLFVSNIFETDLDSLDYTRKRWIDSKLDNQMRFEDELTNKRSFAFLFKADLDTNNSDVKKDMRLLYRESSTDSWLMSFNTSIRTELIQSAIIPSFRDPNNQLRITDWTWYGKLLKSLTSNHPQTHELQLAFDNVSQIANNIFGDIKAAIQTDTFNVAFPGTEIFFQFNHDVKTDIHKSCSLYIDDGVKSLIFDKGSGIQSATIISLFSYYAQSVAKAHTLLCVEEPELYLHPHARRVVSSKLDSFTQSGNQVVATTHSPEFINSVNCDLNIITVTKNNTEGTSAKNLVLGKKKSLLIDNNYNEIFFADAVIVCEGFDDKIIRWIADELHPGKLDSLNISVLSAGGKDNLTDLVSIISGKLNIKCYPLADFDYLLRDQSTEACDKKASHKNITNLGPTYFCNKYIFDDKGKEKHKYIQQLRQTLKSANPDLFFTAKTCDEINAILPGIKTVTEKMRLAGLGILDGEIENYSKNTTILSPSNKLSLKTIFQISQLLVGGQKISEIMETKHIGQFLNKIIHDLENSI